MKRVYSSVLIVLLALVSCKNKESDNTVTLPIEKSSSEKQIIEEEFIEGAIAYKLSLSDSILEQFIRHISQDPLYGKDLAKSFINKLGKEDKESLTNFLKNNPDFIKQYGTLPFIKNNIYLAGYEVVYKGEGASYILENKWNDILDNGWGYAASTLIPNTEMNFTYNKEFLNRELLQTNITIEDYDRVATGKMVEIAGYKVEEIVYTLKNTNKVLPQSLVVYSSKLFNPVINKVMPYNVPEEGGILKLDVLLNTKEKLVMTYEAEMIVKRKLLEQETSILATKVFFNTVNDKSILELEERLSKAFMPLDINN